MKKGTAILVVGFTGMGKTHWLREQIKKTAPESRLIFDVNAEYTDLYSAEFQDDFEEFSKEAYRTKNGVIVFEESTSFISNRGASVFFLKTLVKKRHHENLIFIVFHSFRSIPVNVYDLCNYVVIFKTQDSIDLVQSRFENPKLLSAFEQIKNAPMIQGDNGSYSPHLFIPTI